jgi:ethanolaminephosphotransferase
MMINDYSPYVNRYSYLTDKARINLHQYQYKGSDASLFSKLLNPFWEACVKFIPSWMAPNMVTFLGFIGVVLAFGVMIMFNPRLDRDVPAWVSWFCAIMLFFYQTMDAIDGKHARNTKSGSVLGELFDHGVDAFVTALQTIVAIGALQLGSSYWSYACIFLVYLTSYLIVWEAYVTDEMRFGLLNGPTEAILFVIGLLGLNAMFGSSLWSGFRLLWTLPVNKALILLFVLADSTALYETVVNVIERAPHRKEITGGLRGSVEALVPFAGTLVLYTIYAIAQPTLLYNHPVTFLLVFGMLCSYLQTRMIIAKACQDRVGIVFSILYPLPLLVFNAIFWGRAVVFMHYAYLLYISVLYSHFIYNCISEITMVLGIEAFSIRKHPQIREGFLQNVTPRGQRHLKQK